MAPHACVPPTVQPLIGRFVRLDPMVREDAADLFPVHADPTVYTQGYIMAPPPKDLAEMARRVEATVTSREGGRLAEGKGRMAYTIRLVADSDLGAAGTVVGTSSLGDVLLDREHVHLGWTMYGSRWWGTVVNPEAKFLLLAHAFETCGFGRVKIQTDAINSRSRAAILKLGAQFEGITRRDSQRADGSWRDTAVYSILIDEWPAVRRGLLARLG